MTEIKYPEEVRWQAQISLVRKLEKLQTKADRRRTPTPNQPKDDTITRPQIQTKGTNK